MNTLKSSEYSCKPERSQTKMSKSLNEDERGRNQQARRKPDRSRFIFKDRDKEERNRRLNLKRRLLSREERNWIVKDICLSYIQGYCSKGADCSFSHIVAVPPKMEVCKFYVMASCLKRDDCLYLHEDFPCKFFHTGQRVCNSGNECKFSHEPLTDSTRKILLKMQNDPRRTGLDLTRVAREEEHVDLNSGTQG